MKKILFVLLLLIGAAWLFLPVVTEYQEIRLKNLEYQQRIAELKQKNEELAEEKRLLIEDPEYLERVARDKLGLVKEGEVVYKIVPEKQ